MTTKGLRYIQMRENAIRENLQKGLITVEHQSGATNMADMFTKEDKDTNHFIEVCDATLSKPLNNQIIKEHESHREATPISMTSPSNIPLRAKGGVDGQTPSEPLATLTL